MEDEKLIEMVSKYEFIYNLKHPKYMDNVKKDIAWQEIGKQVKQSAIVCKKRWQCLRDSYRRALNKKKGKSGRAARNIKPWKYEHEMAFLTPFFIERKALVSEEITSDELSDNADENQETESTVPEILHIEVDATPPNVSDAATITSDEFPKKELQQKEYSTNPAMKIQTYQSEPSGSAILMAKFLDDQKLQPPRGHDELDRFFLNISETVKKFSPYVQALAKNKIFSLVSEMELQQFAPRTQYAFKVSPQSASTSETPIRTSPENWNDQTLHYSP